MKQSKIALQHKSLLLVGILDQCGLYSHSHSFLEFRMHTSILLDTVGPYSNTWNIRDMYRAYQGTQHACTRIRGCFLKLEGAIFYSETAEQGIYGEHTLQWWLLVHLLGLQIADDRLCTVQDLFNEWHHLPNLYLSQRKVGPVSTMDLINRDVVNMQAIGRDNEPHQTQCMGV